jgi:hypothetical protein
MSPFDSPSPEVGQRPRTHRTKTRPEKRSAAL